MKQIQTNFKKYHQLTCREIEKELQKFSNDWEKYIQKHFPDLKKVNNLLINSFLGGKMIRGTLVKFGYELLQTDHSSAIIKPATAYEILHASIIIHDDIIDKSSLRRGKPTLYKILGDNHYGMSQTICLGDLGIMLSNRLIAQSDFQSDVKNRALNFFLQTVINTVLGETLDVISANTKQKTEKEVVTIHKMKTAQYTFTGPLALGAIFGEAPEDFLEIIKRFGEPLGIAFQIQDDMLGIFGDEKTIGKSTTSDIEENKSTLLFTYSLAHGTKKQKKFLKTYYGKKGITKTQQEEIKRIFLDTGALSYSQKKINELISEANSVIPLLTKEEKKQELLTQLTDLLIKRNK